MFRFPNNTGFFLSPYCNAPMFAHTVGGTTSIDAAGESITVIGRVTLEGGSASPAKTISSAGGAIYFGPHTPVFVNAGSTIRVGIQDTNLTTGIEDGVFDVHGDLVGGTDVLVSQAHKKLMTTGSKTLNHGDLIAVSFEVISRGGADTFNLSRSAASNTGTLMYPYITQDTGAGPIFVSISRIPSIALEFDDGTIGWIGNVVLGELLISLDFSVNDTPDEYAMVFTSPVDMKASAWGGRISADIGVSDFEFVIYSDPLGTPVVEQTVPFSKANILFGTVAYMYELINPEFLFRANTMYAIAIRPTVVSVNFGIDVIDFFSGNEKLRRTTALGENWALGTRTNQTGPFVLTEYRIPDLGLYISEIQTGGERSNTFG